MAHGPSMPCPLTWLGAYPGVENLQQTSAAGFDERDHDLRHGTARRISQPQ